MKSLFRIFNHYLNAILKLVKAKILKKQIIDGVKIQSGLDDIIKANAFIEFLCRNSDNLTFEYIE